MGSYEQVLMDYARNRADLARQRGQILGGAVEQIGQIPQQIQQQKHVDALTLLEQAKAAREQGQYELAQKTFQQAEILHAGQQQVDAAALAADPNNYDAAAAMQTAATLHIPGLADYALSQRLKFHPPPVFHPAGSVGVSAETGQPIPGAVIPPKMEPGTVGEYVTQQRAALKAVGQTEQPSDLLKWTKDFHAATRAEPSSEWDMFAQSYAKSKGAATFDALTPADQLGAHRAFATAKQTPETAALADLRETLLKLQIGQQPTREDAAGFARQLVEHKLAPSQVQLFGGFGAAGAAFKRMVGTEALKLDPNFDWEEAQSTFDLSKSTGFQNTVRYMDAVTESMPRLMQNATKLANGKFKTWNAILNAGKEQFSDTDLKAFKTDAVLVGDEIAKILQGGGTGSGTSDAKLKQAQELISASDSVPAIASAMNEVQALIANRRRSLVRGTYYERQGAAAGPETNVVPPPVVPVSSHGVNNPRLPKF